MFRFSRFSQVPLEGKYKILILSYNICRFFREFSYFPLKEKYNILILSYNICRFFREFSYFPLKSAVWANLVTTHPDVSEGVPVVLKAYPH